MANTSPTPVLPLDYEGTRPVGPADPRRMFLYLLPSAVCIGAFLPTWMIEAYYPDGDSRNFSGPACMLVTAPLGLAFGAMAIREAIRPRRLRALLWSVGWNLLVAVGPWATFWVLVRFGLLKHT